MEAYSDKVGDLDPFSDAQEYLAEALFGTSHALAFDPEGRVVLHENLREHAGITNEAVFVGKGKSFQIWEPTLHRSFQKRARARALSDRSALAQRPQIQPSVGGSVENGT